MSDRSTVLGLLSGALCVALAVWGRYADWWWYDNLAHLLGGLALGSLVGRSDTAIGQDLAIVGCLTAGWEAFEYRKGVYPWDGTLPKRAVGEDTVLDTLLVAIGAYAGARWADDSTDSN